MLVPARKRYCCELLMISCATAPVLGIITQSGCMFALAVHLSSLVNAKEVL